MRKILFYLSFTLVIMHNMFKTVTLMDADVFNVVYGIALAIFAFLGVLNLDGVSARKAVFVILATVFLAFFALFSHDLFLITVWLGIIAFRGENFDKVVRYDLFLKTICLLFVLALYSFGYTDSGVFYDGDRVYSGMGFENPNIFSAYVMSVVIDALYLRRERLTFIDLLLVFGVSISISLLVGSRTQPIIMVLTAVFLFINRNTRLGIGIQKKKIAKLICHNVFCIMACISFLLVAIFINNPSSQVMQDFDEMMSGRLRISSRIIDNYGVDFVGNDSFSKEVGEATMDNQYVYIVVMYGVLPLLIICAAMYRYMSYLDVRQKHAIYIIMFMFIVGGLAEKSCLRIQYNVFILFSSYMIYGEAIVQKYRGIASRGVTRYEG